MKRSFSRSIELQSRLHGVVPGGSHTYSKGDDQFPELMPPLIERGQGCRVWDVDGNEYIEYGMGLRAVSLGHAWPAVNAAAARQMEQGINFARPALIELQAAETFLELVPGADMVKFAKNGSDVVSAAIRLARAHTGRDRIAICEDHPFFSTDDWFLVNTPLNRGIPESQAELTVSFRYNDISSVDAVLDQHPGEIAAFLMEPEKNQPLDPGFMQALQQRCESRGALLILDEMITGFRWHMGGAQTLYGVVPDLSTFGKAMGNGFSISALAGKRELMELGGIEHEEARVFLLSTTHGAEGHALAAFMAVVDEYRKHDVIDYLARQGERLRAGVEAAIETHGLSGHFAVHGHPASLVYATADSDGNPSQAFRTLFMQECLRRGLLAPSLVLSFAHRDEDIAETLDIIQASLAVYRDALEQGIDKYLEGRAVQPVFRKFNRPGSDPGEARETGGGSDDSG